MTQQPEPTRRPRRRAAKVLRFELLRQETSVKTTRPRADGQWHQTSSFALERGGVMCVGAHLLVDLHDAHRLDQLDLIDRTLLRCAEAAGAILLRIHLHRCGPTDEVSGVAVLAEGHISIHCWPQRGYAALDIFICGQARPECCIEVLLEAFAPRRVAIEEILRGRQ